MKEKIGFIVLFTIVGFSGIAFAVSFTPLALGQISSTDVVNSTSFTKNQNGTLNEIESITRTIVIDPSILQNEINSTSSELSTLQNEQTTLNQESQGALMSGHSQPN